MNDPPRFLVYTDSLAYRNTLEDLLQHSRAGIFHDWEAFAQAVGRGERAVAFVIPEIASIHLSRLTRFRDECPHTPAALVTIISRANLKAANLLPAFDEVLALKELSDLLGTFIRLDKQSLLHEAASLLESMNHIPLDLRQTLAKACRKSELSDADPVALRDVVLESLYVSEHVPAIVDAKVGSDGAVWLKRYGSAASDQRWLVVPDSAQHFEVALPAEGEVAAVAHDGLWMLTQNGSRPAVSRYRFVQEASCGRDAL